MARKGRAFVEQNFNLRQLTGRLEELYRRVIRDFPRP
jgi:hypothetical protein